MAKAEIQLKGLHRVIRNLLLWRTRFTMCIPPDNTRWVGCSSLCSGLEHTH